MAEEIKDLIAKINQEGIEAAQGKSREIENAAKLKADEILAKAKSDSNKILTEAKEQIAKMQEREKALLVQAGRDMLLSLRKEIDAMLQRVINSSFQQVLSPENMYKLIADLAKSSASQEISLSMKKEDLEAMEKQFLSKLKEETKKGITLSPGEDIRGGFTISFDSGRSCFDFTDKSLAEYIGKYLKPKLNEILDSTTR